MQENQLKTIELVNSNGMELQVINFGATITRLIVPDKNGKKTNVVVGLNQLEDYISEQYLKEGLYLGCVVGRYAGRISNGGFIVNDKKYDIYNEKGVHLHGGKEGFDKKYWTIDDVKKGKNSLVTLSYLSEHLEEGYPGNLKVWVTYELSESNTLKITFKAKTDKATPVNLTNHSYFNLDGTGTIKQHFLKICSFYCLEVDKQLIPTGELVKSKNTRLDFNDLSKIGSVDFIGFDDTFVLDKSKSNVAVLVSKKTGIKMEVVTDKSAIVVFTHPKLPTLPFSSEFSNFPSICFETQNYPDAPNKINFPNSILFPEDIYKHYTSFKFNTEEQFH